MALNRLAAWWRNLTNKTAVERDLEHELSSYVALAAEAKKQHGLSKNEAHVDALRELGGVEQVKEEIRANRIGFGLETLLNDVRYGLRVLIKKPAFTITAVIALALGIGATTSIFTIVRGVLLKSLPYPEPERLVAVGDPLNNGALTAVPYRNYLDWRAEQHVFEDMCARLPAGGVLIGDGEPERIFGRLVTASFFPTLRIQPQLGRFFTDAEDRIGGERVIVISDGLWRRHFGADPEVVGRSIHYNGGTWTVIGVMPRNFDFYGRANENNDFFAPLGQLEMNDTRRRGYPVRLTGRLKAGVSLHEARAEIQTLARRSALQYPAAYSGHPIDVRPFLSDYVGDTAQALGIISAAVVLLLLISCANVANLTLARAMTRSREIALRLAIGASRGRIIRLLLIESLLVAAIGGTLGVALAYWGIDLLKATAPDSLPRISEVQLDGWSALATALITVTSAILFGLTPALQSTRPDLETALRQNSSNSFGGANTRRLRSSMIVAELALSLMLLIGCGLLVQSFRHVMSVDSGFDSRNILTFRLRLPDMKYPQPEQAMNFLKAVRDRLQSLPGVETVAVTSGFPLGRSTESNYWIEGTPQPAIASEWPLSLSFSVNETYFRALGIPLLAGRAFTEQDTTDTPAVSIVDEEFAHRNFPNTPLSAVVGRRFLTEGAGESWREIVGIVGHVKQNSLDEQARPEIYRPWTQINPLHPGEWLRAMDLLVKANVDPRQLVPAIRREVHAVDPEQPLGPVHTLESLLHDSMGPRRLNLALITIFSVAALVLSAVGLYGVMSYAVGQRRREIGVRIALGATRGNILRLVLANGMLLTVCGIAIGLIASCALSRLMQNLLFGVTPTDALTFTTVSLLLGTVALLAAFVPARKATRVDPTVALRCE